MLGANGRPFTKCLIFGAPGSGKTGFLASWPKPMLVFFWDAYGKDTPLLREPDRTPIDPAKVTQLQTYMIPTGGANVEIIYRDVQRSDGLIRIEYYHDLDPQNPAAFARFRARLNLLYQEFNTWQTVGNDSVTSMEFLARMNHKYHLNRQEDKAFHSRDPRKWFGGSTDDLEEVLKGTFKGLPMNVVVTAHVDQDRDETASGIMARNPSAPGRLRGGLSDSYQELYHSYVIEQRNPATAEVERHFVLQTQPDSTFNAATQIDAPSPCWSNYDALWVNYDAQRGKG